MEVADLTGDDWARIGELVTGYADLRLGGTDASVIAVAERCGATRIATLNHRHFHVVRPRRPRPVRGLQGVKRRSAARPQSRAWPVSGRHGWQRRAADESIP